MDIISERIDRRFNCSKILGETYEFSECISIDRDFNLSMYKKQQIDDSMSFFILNEEQKIRIMNILNNRHSFYDTTVWNHMIKRFFDFSKNDKIKRKLKNIENKIPDYTKL